MARTSTSGTARITTLGEAWDTVHDAAKDYADRKMRAGNRAAWNRSDTRAYTDELYRLLAGWGFWDGERDQPKPLYFAMQADRSAPFAVAA